MHQDYVAFCKCGGAVGHAVADTVAQQMAASNDVKRWMRKGYRVDLVQHEGTRPPDLCKCKKPSKSIEQ